MAIPALREPREDIPLLAEHFIKRFEAEYNKKTLGLFDKAMEACMHYSWPGNIRELENAIERCIILIESNESISVQALFPRALEEQMGHSDRISLEGTLVHPQKEDSGWVEQLFASGLSLDEIEERLMRVAKQWANKNISGAARLLGLTRPPLAYRLKKIGIET